MEYVFSPSQNLFYPFSLREEYEKTGTWPDDGVEVDEALFTEFTNAPEGKMRVTGKDGMPAWADIPPPTKEQYIKFAEITRMGFRSTADSEIAWRQDAVDVGIASEEETAALAAWKEYRVLLMRVDTNTAPNITWPEQPSQ